MLFAVLGLSVLLVKSALAFQIVKYIRAVYLIYLGIKILLNKKEELKLDKLVEKVNYTKIYISGILTNTLNPKVALFFLAFVPQLINTSYINNTLSFLVSGLTFLSTGTLWCLLISVIFSPKLSSRIRRNTGFKYILDKVTGRLFITLGVKLALSER